MCTVSYINRKSVLILPLRVLECMYRICGMGGDGGDIWRYLPLMNIKFARNLTCSRFSFRWSCKYFNATKLLRISEMIVSMAILLGRGVHLLANNTRLETHFQLFRYKVTAMIE